MHLIPVADHPRLMFSVMPPYFFPAKVYSRAFFTGYIAETMKPGAAGKISVYDNVRRIVPALAIPKNQTWKFFYFKIFRYFKIIIREYFNRYTEDIAKLSDRFDIGLHGVLP